MSLIFVSILNTIIICSIIYLMLSSIKFNNVKSKIIHTKAYKRLSEYVLLGIKRKILPKKLNTIKPIFLFVVMLVLFIIAFILFNSYLKVASTALILSIPFFLSPIFVIKILINNEKKNIVKILPMYAVNIKNHISDDNNIIVAFQRTTVEEPLKKYIDVFKANISRGMNVIEAFDLLKESVDVAQFSVFIDACQVCYINGGSFNSVLERYMRIIAKENVHKESTKEKAYADVLTLIVMAILNIIVIVMFVFTNKEYSQIIRETFLGRVILNSNAVSYIVIAYLISKIYKEE